MFTCDVIKTRKLNTFTLKVEHFHVSNVIYHKFSHGAVSYTLNGENVDVKLELAIITAYICILIYILFDLYLWTLTDDPGITIQTCSLKFIIKIFIAEIINSMSNLKIGASLSSKSYFQHTVTVIFLKFDY